MRNYDVAIIGGGISGLSASIYLAKAGMSVVVLEKGKQIGGRAKTINKNGALLNLGAHAIFKGGATEQVMKELDIQVTGKTPSTRGKVIWNKQLLTLPSSVTTMLTTKLLSWSSKFQLVKLLAKLQKINPNSDARMSLRKWAEMEIHDPMVRNLFYALCQTNTYCKDQDNQVASAVIDQVRRGLKGVLYIDGGWQTIIEQLRQKAMEHNVTILKSKNVTSIEFEHLHHIYSSDGEKLLVPNTILTIGPQQTSKLLKNRNLASIKKWNVQAKPIYAACLDIALRKLPIPSNNFALGLDQPILFTNASRAASLAEDGSQVIHLVKYLDNDSNIGAKMHEKDLENIMDLLQPGWRNEVVARQFLPKMTVAYDSLCVGDTQYFGPSVPEIPGLYIAGDGTGHGEMLADVAFASAKRASMKLIHTFSTLKFQKEA